MTDKKNDRPFVLVLCMTYNHEAYIEDALNGFVMQKTEFPFVVSIIDDASTDNNTSVIMDYLKRVCDADEVNPKIEEYGKVIDATPSNNPNCLLHVVLLNENHFCKKSKQPYYIQFEEKAKYIAMCEGDDYWTDPYKLQKQVDYMEAHPDCSCYAHNSLTLTTKSRAIGLFNKRMLDTQDYPLETFLPNGWFSPTQSLLYRRCCYQRFENQPIFMHGDYSLLINILLKQGTYLHYDNQIMSVYRDGGWASSHYKELDLFDDFVALLTYYKEKSNHCCDDVFDAQIELQKKGKEQYIQQMQEANNNKKLINRIKRKLTRIFKAIC